jgi:hypothetical protein
MRQPYLMQVTDKQAARLVDMNKDQAGRALQLPALLKEGV